jgi:hypothetical protein
LAVLELYLILTASEPPNSVVPIGVGVRSATNTDARKRIAGVSSVTVPEMEPPTARAASMPAVSALSVTETRSAVRQSALLSYDSPA